MLATLLDTAGTAGHKDEDCGDQGADGGDNHQPDSGTPASDATRVALGVDGVLDDSEASKVADHGHESRNKGQAGEDRGDERADDVGRQAEKEAQEAEGGGDGVEDQDLGEDSGAITIPVGEGDVVNVVQDVRGAVTNVNTGALITTTVISRLVFYAPQLKCEDST